MAAKFDPDEAKSFLHLTVAGLLMNRDVGSPASAVGALLAIAKAFGAELTDQSQLRAAEEWAAEAAKDPLGIKRQSEAN